MLVLGDLEEMRLKMEELLQGTEDSLYEDQISLGQSGLQRQNKRQNEEEFESNGYLKEEDLKPKTFKRPRFRSR